MNSKRHDIIVIGASAGGFQAVSQLLTHLSQHLQASVFLVIHLSDENSANGIVNYFKKEASLDCVIGEQGAKIEYGKVYIAPPDNHMLLKDNHIILSRGARENKYRPSIDLTFRSAAAYYGARVVGVILTGMMEDGTSGMAAVRKGGGVCIVQDPKEAVFSDMPLSVLSNMKVDYSLPLSQIGEVISKLVDTPSIQQFPIPEDIIREAGVAERILLGTQHVEDTGEISPVVCPECGGSLWKHDEEGVLRFKCHTGHSFIDSSLLRYKSDGIEETMWVALRMLEEKRHLINLMGERTKTSGENSIKAFKERARETEVHIGRLREILLGMQNLHPMNNKFDN